MVSTSLTARHGDGDVASQGSSRGDARHLLLRHTPSALQTASLQILEGFQRTHRPTRSQFPALPPNGHHWRRRVQATGEAVQLLDAWSRSLNWQPPKVAVFKGRTVGTGALNVRIAVAMYDSMLRYDRKTQKVAKRGLAAPGLRGCLRKTETLPSCLSNVRSLVFFLLQRTCIAALARTDLNTAARCSAGISLKLLQRLLSVVAGPGVQNIDGCMIRRGACGPDE
jgi:hypothetical protein